MSGDLPRCFHKFPFILVQPVKEKSIKECYFKNFSVAKEWNTSEINKDVADYELLGLSLGKHQKENIQKDCFFRNSKEKTGECGVRVTFKDKVVIESFEFRTRQDSVKFKIKIAFQIEMQYNRIVV